MKFSAQNVILCLYTVSVFEKKMQHDSRSNCCNALSTNLMIQTWRFACLIFRLVLDLSSMC